MSNQTARDHDSRPSRPRLAAVKWAVPSSLPDTSEVDGSWAEDAPRHSFIALKGENPFNPSLESEAVPAAASAPLAYDVWESPHAIVVLVDLPGVEADQVALSLGSQALHLDVTLPMFEEARQGVAAGHYEVRLEGPLVSGPDAIDASLSNGLLRIRIVKDSAGARRVAIVTDSEDD
jgi:HSP20 family molecular chaperone IbpA